MACSTILVLSEKLSAGQEQGNCELGFLDDMPQTVEAPIKVEFQNPIYLCGELKKKKRENEGLEKYMGHSHRPDTTCVRTHRAGMYFPLLFSSLCDFSNNKLPSGTARLDPL